MNIETRLIKEHWDAIRRSYESQMWTNSILDSIHYISDLIRNKTGLLGDGTALIGQALGGKSPKLKLNRFESETEKNIQAGIEHLLRGIYQAIRNPRSHERIEDDQADAESIIVFIDYLARQIGAAKSSFSVDQAVNQILDDNFVPNERYANLIIHEIPPRHYFSVTLEIFKRRSEADPQKLKSFFTAIIKLFSEEDKKYFFEAVSNELRELTDDSALRSILQILDTSYWLELSEIARLRTEHRLLRNLKDGKCNTITGKCISGALATWSCSFWKYFTLKQEFEWAVVGMLESSNDTVVEYTLRFPFSHLDSLVDRPSTRLEKILIDRLSKGDQRFFSALEAAWLWQDESWSQKLETARTNFQAASPTPDEDEIPF